MPDAREMSGIPRPVTDLPAGTISVRLVRGDLSNNITKHPVELHVAGKIETVQTDEAGRAEFRGVPSGTPVKAVAVVDGERLESQEFPAPRDGGIRMLLVATDKDKAARAAEEAKAPPIAGQVVIAGDSRLILEPDDESVRVFYLLQITNTARAPVNPPTPFIFDLPREALRTTVLEDSSPLASAAGTRVRVQGPFPPGVTMVNIGYGLPAPTGTVEISQTFPAPFQDVAVFAKKAGDAQLTSPQFNRVQDVAANGETYIAGAVGTVAAGQPIVLTFTGLAYRSRAPRWTALSFASAIVLIGVWAGRRGPDPVDRRAERKALIARREKLFQDLVRLEHDERRGRGERSRYAARRDELLRALEPIYGALDAEDTSPDPAGRSSQAA